MSFKHGQTVYRVEWEKARGVFCVRERTFIGYFQDSMHKELNCQIQANTRVYESTDKKHLFATRKEANKRKLELTA